LIHGTNSPASVGKRSSSGCIRMYPKDVEELFSQVRLKTSVKIVNQPYKAGWYEEELYIAAYDLFEDQPPPLNAEEVNALQASVDEAIGNKDILLDWEAIHRVVRKHKGFPHEIPYHSPLLYFPTENQLFDLDFDFQF